jgi:hypothetical protein
MKTENYWPLGIIGAFGLFFCGLATVIVIAATHHETMVSENYYEQELTFQDQINATARATECGAAISTDAASGDVIIRLPAAQLAQKFSGTIALYRPSEPKLDREYQLEPKADGTQMLNVSQIASGLWLVRVKWNVGGQDYFLEQKITI